jgi:HlyD family secretion protein
VIATSEYRSVLERALELLPTSTRVEREAVYRRARERLVDAMRAKMPPIPEDLIEEERRRLDEMIQDVESSFEDAPPTAAELLPREPSPASSRVHQRADANPRDGAHSRSGSEPRIFGDSAARASDDRNVVGRGLGVVRGAVRRRLEPVDPTLPVILEFQRPSTAIVSAPMPRIARAITWLIASMVLAMIVIAGLISVDQVVTARGIVISRSPNLLVQPLETAIVRRIDVTEGETVKAGQILAELDPTIASADVGALAAQVSSLGAEAARLQAEASGKPFAYTGDDPDWLLQLSIYGHRQAEFQLKMENYKHKLDELSSTISKSESDILGYSKREEVAESVEGIRKELEARQLGSRLNTLAATDARTEMERSRRNAEDELQSAKRDREALQSESDSFAQGWSADVSQKLSDVARKLSDAREDLNKAKLRRSMVMLRADQDGIVQSLAKVSVGSVMMSGQPFITLVPTAAALEVEVNVPGSEAGFVHDSDPVAIKFDTFPFSQYGMAEGRVRVLSPNSFSPREEERNPTSSAPVTSSGEPFYRARISIDRVALHGTPSGFHLMPGMPVTTDIKVGRRTVLKYFLGKVLPVAQEGLREPQN